MKNSLVKFQKQDITVFDKNGNLIPNGVDKKNNTLLYVFAALIGFLVVFIPVQYDSYVTKQKIEKIKKEIEQNGKSNRYAD